MADPNPDELDRWLTTARRAADAAARVHRRWSGRIDILGADTKGFSDFVSQVDLESQEAALSVISDSHPDHRILAEESGTEEGGRPDEPWQLEPDDGRPLWVVDPLDGTTNFLHGHPNHAASVAVALAGRPVAACVHASATSERWSARRGAGAWRNGRRIHVSAPRPWEQSLVSTGFTFKGQNDIERFVRELAAVRRAGAGIRRCGAAAIDLCYVADGRYEGFWEGFLSPWDYAAGWLVVEEAGGLTARVDGTELGLEAGSLLAANHPDTLRGLMDLIRGRD